MKWMTYLLFVFITGSQSAQNLYLKFKTETPKTDSIANEYVSNISFKDFNSLEEFLNDFSKTLQFKGYLNSRLGKPKPINDSVFKVETDLRQQYTAVKINNISEYPNIESKFSAVINVQDLPGIIDTILDRYSEEGQPFTSVKLDHIGFDGSDTLSANLNISVSQKRNLDKIELRGYDKFPKAFIKNYANLKPGMTFNRSKLIEQSEQLNALQFVNQTKSPQVQFTKDSTALFVYLDRRQANSFDGFIGFNNSDENEFQLNGNIDLNLVNNFHGGEHINLNYKNDGNAQEWFDASVRLPYLFKTRFTLEAGLGFFKQDSTFSNTAQHLKLDFQINSNINIGVNALFESSSKLLDNDLTRQDIQDYQKNRYGLSFVYDQPKRYNRLFLNSQQIEFNFGVGKRQTNNIEENQLFFEIDAGQIFKINKRQYVFTGIDAGYMNSNRYLSNELYRFGGINTIRGFVENRFFANLFGTLQTEYRYVLGANLYVHSVLDYGVYENEIDRVNENLYSLGFGFGLETQAGLLRLIFANGGSDSQNVDIADTQIHLKFVSVF